MAGMRPERRVAVLLAVATLAVYAQVAGHDFVSYDDPDYVSGNPSVRAGLTRAGLSWALTTGHAGNWHPLTWLSHMLDCQLFGLRPGAHHLTNVLLHTANTLLLFVLLRGMSGALWPSAAVASFFALHPLHVESVAWVSERKDVLSTLFWMLTLLAYWRYTRQPSLRRYLSVLVLLALGLMAKPMLVTLPLVMLLLDVWPLGRLPLAAPEGRDTSHVERSARRQEVRPGGDPRARKARRSEALPRARARRAAWPPGLRLVLEKVPFVALAAASSVVTFVVQLHGAAVAPVDTLPFGARLADALVAYAASLGKMLYPAGLDVDARSVRRRPARGLRGRHGAAAALLAEQHDSVRARRRGDSRQLRGAPFARERPRRAGAARRRHRALLRGVAREAGPREGSRQPGCDLGPAGEARGGRRPLCGGAPPEPRPARDSQQPRGGPRRARANRGGDRPL